MSETDKLRYSQKRCSDYKKEYTALTENGGRGMVIQLDEADLLSVIGGEELLDYYYGSGTLAECIDMAGRCVGKRSDRMLVIIESLTLESLNRFMDAVSELSAPDAHIIMGAMVPNDWKEEYDGTDDGASHFGFHIVMPAKPLRMDCPLLLGPTSVLKSPKSTYTNLTPFAAGGTSICYKAVDADGSSVLIKEVYPISLGRKLTREGDSLVPRSDNEKVRESVSTRMMLEVLKAEKEKELERDLQNDGRDFFEKNADYFRANNTFYTVYNDYGHGTLDSLSGKITLREAAVLTKRILEALCKLHESDYLHLDISPENILLGSEVDGVPQVKFIDLGSLVHKKMIGRMESFPCKEGYSPFELFSAGSSSEARDAIAPHTDTFSVGAVFYNLLTGRCINWDVCRRGNMSIIKPSDEGIRRMTANMVCVDHVPDYDDLYYGEFEDDNDQDGIKRISNELYVLSEKGMVSPRVLEAVNQLLAIAVCNNPSRRFQDAGCMMKAMEGLIAEIDKHEYFFEKAGMPYDFIYQYIEKEKQTDTESSIPFVTKRIMQKRYDPDELRLALVKNRDVMLEDGSLLHNREDVKAYIEKYGDKYHEIIFFDEGSYKSEIFNGTLDSGYTDIRQLDCDEKTLIVFYGRKERLGSGIVKMQDKASKKEVFALQLLLQKGKHPHVIRIVPSKLYNTAGRWLSFAFPFFCAAPLFLAVLMGWKLFNSPYIMNRIMLLLGLESGADQMMIEWVRNTVEGCSLIGLGELPEWGSIFGYNTDGSLLLLNFMYRAGIIPAGALLFAGTMLSMYLYDIAKRSYLSMAAYTVLISRVVRYVLSNLGLWPPFVGAIFTEFLGIFFNLILLAAAIGFGMVPKKGGERAEGWNGLRFWYGLAFQWFFRFVYITLGDGVSSMWDHSEPEYIISAFVLAALLDISLVILKNNTKYRDFLLKGSLGEKVTSLFFMTDEEEEYEFDSEEISIKKI